jgi:hypothetical protein
MMVARGRRPGVQCSACTWYARNAGKPVWIIWAWYAWAT